MKTKNIISSPRNFLPASLFLCHLSAFLPPQSLSTLPPWWEFESNSQPIWQA